MPDSEASGPAVGPIVNQAYARFPSHFGSRTSARGPALEFAGSSSLRYAPVLPQRVLLLMSVPWNPQGASSMSQGQGPSDLRECLEK